MKKIALFGVLIPIFILVGWVSYAGMTKEPISENNLSDLKGKWEGWRTVSGRYLRTELEIDNDTLPLRGRFLFHDMQRQDRIVGTHAMEFKQGKVKDNTFYLQRGQDEFKLSLHKGDGKMKLDGDFSSMGYWGTITLNKK